MMKAGHTVGGPAGYVDSADVIQINHINIEKEFLNMNDKFVPVATDIEKELPKWRGKRYEHVDRLRYNAFEWRLEEKYYELIRLPRDKITIATNHRQVDIAVKEMCDAMEANGDVDVLCGLDSEKEFSTLQTSIKIPNHYGPGCDYEKTILFQMNSVEKGGEAILKEGVPASLKGFLMDPRLIFMGKAVKQDIVYVAKTLQIDDKTRNSMKYIELDQLFKFVFTLLWHPDYARQYLISNHDIYKCVQHFLSILGNVGLKTICRLAWPKMTLNKQMDFCDQHNNFDLHRGPLTPAEIEYAALDAVVSRSAGERICHEILRIRVTLFTRKYGRPAGDFVDTAILRILNAFDDAEVRANLSDIERREYESLVAARKSELDMHYIDVQYDIRRWAKKHQWAIAKLKKERRQGDFTIEFIETPKEVLESRPFKWKAAQLERKMSAPPVDDDVKLESDGIDYATVDKATFWSSVDIEPTPPVRSDDRAGGEPSPAPSPSTALTAPLTPPLRADVRGGGETAATAPVPEKRVATTPRGNEPAPNAPPASYCAAAPSGKEARLKERDSSTSGESSDDESDDSTSDSDDSDKTDDSNSNVDSDSDSPVEPDYERNVDKLGKRGPKDSKKIVTGDDRVPPSPPQPVPPPSPSLLPLISSLPDPPSIPPESIPSAFLPTNHSRPCSFNFPPDNSGRNVHRPGFIIDAIKALFKKGTNAQTAIRRLISKDPRKMADNCLEALTAFAKEAYDRHCRADAVAALTDALDGEALHRFCVRVIATDALGRG